MTERPLTQTHSFNIRFDDASANAQRRAQAIADRCERDWATMCGWFGVDNPLSPDMRGTVVVHMLPPNDNGLNHEWAGSGTLIEVSPFDSAFDQPLADDFAESIFVAEGVEVLMTYRNQVIGHATWDPLNSSGEALSCICQELLYTDACYSMRGQGYPRSRFWLITSDWHNWIDNTDPSDRIFESFGCGILFIAYLMGQCGLSIDQIIQADGVSLEDKFHHLTGRAGGYAEFTGVLHQFFAQPIDLDTTPLFTDFCFPLLAAENRSVAISHVDTLYLLLDSEQASVTLPLPAPCSGTVTSQYTQTNSEWKVRLSAAVAGFANPLFSWSLLTATGSVAIPADGTVESDVQWAVASIDPADPFGGSGYATQPVHVHANTPSTASSPHTQEPTARLDLFLSGAPGRVLGTVQCEVSDVHADGTTRAAIDVPVQLRTVTYDENYRSAVADCRGRATKLLRDLVKPDLLHQIMPDPPPDLHEAIAIARHVSDLAARASQTGDNKATEIITGIARDTLGMPADWLPNLADTADNNQTRPQLAPGKPAPARVAQHEEVPPE